MMRRSRRVSAKDLLTWVKQKLMDDTLSMSERSDMEAWATLARKRTTLKPTEQRQLKALSEKLETDFASELESASTSVVWPCTTEQIAGLLAVTKKTISQWTRDLGMPKEAHGRYDFRKVFPWWLETIYRAPEDRDESITEARRRERLAKAQIAEIQLENMKGTFVEAVEHERVIVGICQDLRNTMLSWPSRVFPNDNERRMHLREEVFNLLRQFQKWKAFKDPDEKAPDKRKPSKTVARKKPIRKTKTTPAAKPTKRKVKR